MRQDSIIVAFASDDRYATYTGIAIQSLCEHVTKQLHIVILDDNISIQHKNDIESIIRSFSDITLQWIAVDAETIFSKSILIRDITLSAYSRFLLPKFFRKRKD